MDCWKLLHDGVSVAAIMYGAETEAIQTGHCEGPLFGVYNLQCCNVDGVEVTRRMNDLNTCWMTLLLVAISRDDSQGTNTCLLSYELPVSISCVVL